MILKKNKIYIEQNSLFGAEIETVWTYRCDGRTDGQTVLFFVGNVLASLAGGSDNRGMVSEVIFTNGFI